MPFNRTSLSRRRFVQNVSLAAGAFTTSGLVPWGLPEIRPLRTHAAAQKKVLVLGAGLAGLAATWELTNAGHDVTVLEARMRPGGKVHTHRAPFAGDLHAEAGGLAFSDAYTTAIRYIEELGLKKVYLALPTLNTVYHLKGKRLSVPPGENPVWPYALTEEENALGPYGIGNKYIGETLPAERSNPDAWNSTPLASLDEMSLGDYMRSKGASEGAVELIRDTMWYGAAPEQTSMLASAVSDFGLFGGGAPFMLDGGNDTLPRGMAERMSSLIRYGSEVTEIHQSDQGVEVHVRRGDIMQKFMADQVICTIPATVLRGIRFSPGLPADKDRAIHNLPFLDVTRTFVQVSRAFWQDKGEAGSAFSDKPMFLYQHPLYKEVKADERCILEGYVAGPSASILAKRMPGEIIEHNLDVMEQVHPGIKAGYEGGIVTAWSEDPYALGGPSWVGPGDVTRYLEALSKPHGRVHFAGEYTTILRSTMEGALRSGNAAAEAVHES